MRTRLSLFKITWNNIKNLSLRHLECSVPGDLEKQGDLAKADPATLLTTYSVWAVRVSWSQTAGRNSSSTRSTPQERTHWRRRASCEEEKKSFMWKRNSAANLLWLAPRLTPFFISARKWQALCQHPWSSTVRSKATTQNCTRFLSFFFTCVHIISRIHA